MRSFVATLLLIAATLAVYGRVVGFSLLSWDDDIHLTENPYLDPVTFGNVLNFWTSPFENLYIPVSYTFFALETIPARAMGGADGALNPAIYHAGSLALHLACVLMVFALVKRLVGSCCGALLGALVFSLHPLMVESVAWVSETRGLLSTLFSLIAIWFYVRRIDRPERSARYLAIATSAFVLAILAKPSAVALPLVVAAIDWGFLRNTKPPLVPLIGWFAIAIVIVAVTKWLQTDDRIANVLPFWQRPFIAGDALAFYLGKLVTPFRLTFDYGRTPAVAMLQPWFYFAWLVPCSVLVLANRSQQRRQWLAACGVFIAGLTPVLGLVPFLYQDISTVADRYLYLSMLGVALAVATLVARYPRPITIALCGLAIGLLARASVQQTAIWRNDATLYEYGLAQNPRSYIAHFGLANLAQKAERYEDAEKHYRDTLAINPRYVLGHHNLGVLLLLQGRTPDAIKEFEEVLALQPDYANAHMHLGNALDELGETDKSLAEYRAALAINPRLADAEANLGNVLLKAGEFTEARTHLERAVELRPSLAEAHLGLARLETMNHRPVEAIDHLRTAIGHKPNLAAAHLDLGSLLLERGRLSEASEEFDAALDIDAGLYTARMNKGLVFIEQGKLDEGLELIRQALREAPPNSPDARNIQAELEKLEKQFGPKPTIKP